MKYFIHCCSTYLCLYRQTCADVRFHCTSNRGGNQIHLPHWATLWKQRCGWRRWVSLLHCRYEKKQSLLHPGRTTYHPDPDSSEDRQSLPEGETETHVQCEGVNSPQVQLFSCDRSKLISIDASHTLHPETMSPPAQTMVLLTLIPHQSLRLHTLCSTTGSKACCSLSGMGPWANKQRGQNCFNI